MWSPWVVESGIRSDERYLFGHAELSRRRAAVIGCWQMFCSFHSGMAGTIPLTWNWSKPVSHLRYRLKTCKDEDINHMLATQSTQTVEILRHISCIENKVKTARFSDGLIDNFDTIIRATVLVSFFLINTLLYIFLCQFIFLKIRYQRLYTISNSKEWVNVSTFILSTPICEEGGRKAWERRHRYIPLSFYG